MCHEDEAEGVRGLSGGRDPAGFHHTWESAQLNTMDTFELVPTPPPSPASQMGPGIPQIKAKGPFPLSWSSWARGGSNADLSLSL